MQYSKKPSGRAVSMQSGLIYGTALSIMITLIGALIISKLVDTEKLSANNIGYGIMIVLILAAFVGSKLSFCKIKRQKWLVCTASGGLYFLSLLFITGLFFGAQYEAVAETALLIVCGSITAALLHRRTDNLPARKKRSISKNRVVGK